MAFLSYPVLRMDPSRAAPALTLHSSGFRCQAPGTLTATFGVLTHFPHRPHVPSHTSLPSPQAGAVTIPTRPEGPHTVTETASHSTWSSGSRFGSGESAESLTACPPCLLEHVSQVTNSHIHRVINSGLHRFYLNALFLSRDSVRVPLDTHPVSSGPWWQ